VGAGCTLEQCRSTSCPGAALVCGRKCP
jgi:hypothetical protein